jgi:hypothetical protein
LDNKSPLLLTAAHVTTRLARKRVFQSTVCGHFYQHCHARPRFKLTLRGSMMKPTKQNSKRESNSKIELAFIRLLVAVLKTALLIVATMATAQAEPRQHKHNRNYILRRQEAGLVSGVPTTRRIIGKREIDVYRNGLMFEGDNVVGVRAGSR